MEKHVVIGDVMDLIWNTTEKGFRYRVENRRYGKVILFPVGKYAKIMGYAPTEKEILETKDSELINVYRRIDNQNEEWNIQKACSHR